MTKRKPASQHKKPGPKAATPVPPKPKSKVKKAGRPAKYAGPKQIETAQRRLQALEFRRAGYGYREIGEWLDPPCGAPAAFKLVAEAIAEIVQATAETVETVRAMELERLDEMMIKPMEAAKRGDTRAIDAVLKIMDRRAQILGVDAPKKQEHSGPNGGPIPYTRVEVIVVDPAPDGGQRRPADGGAELPDAALGGAVPAAGPV